MICTCEKNDRARSLAEIPPLPSIIHIPSSELAKQIYLTFAATDRSRPSSERTKGQGWIERIENGSDAVQIATSGCTFHPTGCEVCREEPVTTYLRISSSPVIRARRRLRPRCDTVAKSTYLPGRFLPSPRNEPVGLLISS